MHQEILTVLVVDDQPGVRFLFDIIIKEAGHQVYCAQNGLEAVKMVRSIGPDLIFIDARMPIMSGLEAVAEIKQLAPQTGIIFMTAYGSTETIAEAEKLGVSSCLLKPFNHNEIKEIIRNYAQKKSLRETACKSGVL
ncbi:MAG: response regulator [Firmicutes bacterium]|nr:response regulator [Bacillota bacterium]